MNAIRMPRWALSGLGLVLVVCALAACGGQDEVSAARGAAPFRRLVLKNTSGKPATAVAQGPGAPLSVGPVPPGGTQTNESGSTPASSVAVTVSFEGGGTRTGTGTYSSPITAVNVECNEEGGTATVTVSSGPAQTLELR